MGPRRFRFKKPEGKLNGVDDEPEANSPEDQAARPLPAAARRALAEAQVRRREQDSKPPPPPEVNGRDGPDPVRYGDWEKKGIAVDF
jgi:hypothetical protein